LRPACLRAKQAARVEDGGAVSEEPDSYRRGESELYRAILIERKRPIDGAGRFALARVALAATALPQSRFYLLAADGAVQPLYSASEMPGSCLTNAAIDQSSSSLAPTSMKLGMPVMLMPLIDASDCGERTCAVLDSGWIVQTGRRLVACVAVDRNRANSRQRPMNEVQVRLGPCHARREAHQVSDRQAERSRVVAVHSDAFLRERSGSPDTQ
jgi:hypothetical protein